jgi:hypothetical protein
MIAAIARPMAGCEPAKQLKTLRNRLLDFRYLSTVSGQTPRIRHCHYLDSAPICRRPGSVFAGGEIYSTPRQCFEMPEVPLCAIETPLLEYLTSPAKDVGHGCSLSQQAMREACRNQLVRTTPFCTHGSSMRFDSVGANATCSHSEAAVFTTAFHVSPRCSCRGITSVPRMVARLLWPRPTRREQG